MDTIRYYYLPVCSDVFCNAESRCISYKYAFGYICFVIPMVLFIIFSIIIISPLVKRYRLDNLTHLYINTTISLPKMFKCLISDLVSVHISNGVLPVRANHTFLLCEYTAVLAA